MWRYAGKRGKDSPAAYQDSDVKDADVETWKVFRA